MALGLTVASGQESSWNVNSPQEPAPAYGQQNTPSPITENPPLSGADRTGAEANTSPVSYIQPGATFVEFVDTNATNQLGGSSVGSITHALGSLTLQRLWKNYDLALGYVGGVGYFNVTGIGTRLLQQMDFDQKISWKRGHVSLLDSFSYLPEGNFESTYGSLGSEGIASLDGATFSSFWWGAGLGTFGETPRLLNVSLADLTENLSPKSAVTAAAGYAFTHFYGKDIETGGSFLSSSQFSVQMGYNRLLTPQTQVAFVYGYQKFDFDLTGTDFNSNLIQLMYGQRISSRMDFILAAGPQFTNLTLSTPFGSFPDFRIGIAGRAELRYRISKAALQASYERYITSGSGIFAGAESDIARVAVDHPLSRVWGSIMDLGYVRNSRLEALSSAQLATCSIPGEAMTTPLLPICPVVNGNTYIYGFVGGALHRSLGHDFRAFIGYQFNEVSFDNSYCNGLPVCNRIGNRQTATFGFDWTPRPIRLD